MSAIAKVSSRTALSVALLAVLGGCTYDYLQRTDRVAYSAGNAVRANLERETTNPSHGNQYNTKGLGRNGAIAPELTGEQTPVD